MGLKAWPVLSGTAAVLALVAGCGTQNATDTLSTGSTASAEPAEVQRMADETVADLGGTADQREAQHYLQFRELNQPYEECMQEHGIDFVAEYHPISVGYVPDGTSGTWMGALNRKPSDLILANAQAAHDDASGDLPVKYQTREFEMAKDLCSNATGIVETRSANEIGSAELSAEYFEMLAIIEEQLGSIDSYTECMDKAGIDYAAASGEEGWAGLYMYLSSQMPRPPLPGEEANEPWLRYLELEERSLAADAQCRADQHEKGLRLLGPVLQDFRERNADALRASSANWEQFVTEAEEAGWTYPGD